MVVGELSVVAQACSCVGSEAAPVAWVFLAGTGEAAGWKLMAAIGVGVCAWAALIPPSASASTADTAATRVYRFMGWPFSGVMGKVAYYRTVCRPTSIVRKTA